MPDKREMPVRSNKLLISALLLILSVPAVSDREDLREIMRHLADSVVRLIPITAAKEFDADAFRNEAATLKQYFDAAGEHFGEQPVGSQVTYEILKERLDQVDRLSSDQSLISARNLLAESMELCASCHMQDQVSRRGFGISHVKHLNEFQAAEFSYLSRDYDSALASYRNFLEEEKADSYQRSQALDRILSIIAEVVGDLTMANSVLAEISLIDRSEEFRVRQWQSVFTQLQGESLVSPARYKTVSALDQFLASDWPALQSFMEWNEQQAYWMLIRRQLNTLLQSNPDDEAEPVLLYWLAVADRSTHFQFFESPSKRYLERCVRDHRLHPYARKCFDEYELLMIVSYSGSAGISMPAEVRDEINALRKLVYSTR